MEFASPEVKECSSVRNETTGDPQFPSYQSRPCRRDEVGTCCHLAQLGEKDPVVFTAYLPVSRTTSLWFSSDSSEFKKKKKKLLDWTKTYREKHTWMASTQLNKQRYPWIQHPVQEREYYPHPRHPPCGQFQPLPIPQKQYYPDLLINFACLHSLCQCTHTKVLLCVCFCYSKNMPVKSFHLVLVHSLITV